MNIAELKKAKFDLERRLLTELQDSIQAFESETEVRVTGVTLHTIEVRKISGPPVYHVDDLSISIEF